MQSNEIENLYKVYSAVYDNNTRTELNESRDEISEMNLINFSNADRVDLAEDILEETFIKYEMKVIEVETMIDEILTEASTLPGRVEKMKRLEEAFKVALVPPFSAAAFAICLGVAPSFNIFVIIFPKNFIYLTPIFGTSFNSVLKLVITLVLFSSANCLM